MLDWFVEPIFLIYVLFFSPGPVSNVSTWSVDSCRCCQNYIKNNQYAPMTEYIINVYLAMIETNFKMYNIFPEKHENKSMSSISSKRSNKIYNSKFKTAKETTLMIIIGLKTKQL